MGHILILKPDKLANYANGLADRQVANQALIRFARMNAYA